MLLSFFHFFPAEEKLKDSKMGKLENEKMLILHFFCALVLWSASRPSHPPKERLENIAICNVFCPSTSFWQLFVMFSAPELNFGCYLQCFLLPRFILVAIYNVFCSSTSFWLLFAMFSAHHLHFGCYLQCFLLLRFILVVIYIVFEPSSFILAAICNVFCS